MCRRSALLWRVYEPSCLFLAAQADTFERGAKNMDEVTIVVSVVRLVIASITLGFKIAKEIYKRK